eukprot:5809082-Pyramimonas_sp.AAC.2
MAEGGGPCRVEGEPSSPSLARPAAVPTCSTHAYLLSFVLPTLAHSVCRCPYPRSLGWWGHAECQTLAPRAAFAYFGLFWAPKGPTK